MSKALKLYSYCHSSASWRVRTVLNLKNLQYEYIPINLLKAEQKSQDYQKINPNLAVPSLVLENGNLLFESTAIIEFLEELYPNPSLVPKDLYEKAKVRSFCEIVNSAMQPAQNLSNLQRLENDYNINKIEWVTPLLDKGFNALETMLSQQKDTKFCFGDQVTWADVYLYPQVLGSMRRFDYDVNSKFPKVSKIIENLKQEEAFVQSEPRFQPDFPQ